MRQEEWAEDTRMNTLFGKYVCCKTEKQTGLIKNEYLNIQMNGMEKYFRLFSQWHISISFLLFLALHQRQKISATAEQQQLNWRAKKEAANTGREQGEKRTEK